MKETHSKPTPQETLGTLLRGSGKKISVAESCTGGMISHLITTVPGSSEYYLGSVTSYAAEIKVKLLGVNPGSIEKNGIVSSAVAAEMAEGVRKLTGSTYSVATTGWADSSGDEHEEAGTAWIGIAGPSGTITRRIRSHRSRVANIRRFSRSALEILSDYILKG